ncbi:uncharacterized protein LOC126318305 isoform X2 [Schistocerca gregaria]|uniref:uncharacterized protein LOC126318305 isoform X2 n=1 Tax=Schistocerca gregaria TaxID=7010 RepID=UPI00211E69A5|nr:uncharacterized protein LOC126318305 isoform X2 [Schistocerca gregaria]
MDYNDLYHTFLDALASLKELDDEKTYQKVVRLESRLSALKASKELFLNFLENCTNLGLTTKKEVEIYTCKKSLTPAELRAEKIERSRAKATLESQLEFIKVRYSLAPFSETRPVQTEEEDNFHENEREYYVRLIELCIKLALDELSILDREIGILEHMAAGSGDEKKLGSRDSAGSTWQGIMTPEGPIKTFVIDKRLQIRKAVFKPHWTQPTMSVEEAGEIEYNIAQAQAKRQAELAKKNREGEDEEAADLKAREWDDWKDEHPKGSGNTGSKGYVY